MGWWHLPQLCPFGLDSAGDETSSKKGCCKVNVLSCFPEDLLKWTSSFVKWLAFIKAALSSLNAHTSKHFLLWQNIAVLKVFHQNSVIAGGLCSSTQTWFNPNVLC